MSKREENYYKYYEPTLKEWVIGILKVAAVSGLMLGAMQVAIWIFN